jgi:hypothetical protein
VSLIDDMLEGLIGFGRIVSTRLGSSRTVTAVVSGDGAELPDGVEMWGPAGIQSRPPADAEVLFLRRGDELVGIAFKSRQWQVDVVDGEVAIHALGNSGGTQAVLRLQPDGTAILDGASIKLGATAAQFVALSNLVDARLAAMVAAYNLHVHVETGGSTAVPTTLMGAQATVAATKTKAV